MIAVPPGLFPQGVNSCNSAPGNLFLGIETRKHTTEPITCMMRWVAVNFVVKALFSTFKHFNKPNIISDDCLIFRLKTALNKEVQALISTTIKVKEYQNGTNRIK
jgi:hypothetical protein